MVGDSALNEYQPGKIGLGVSDPYFISWWPTGSTWASAGGDVGESVLLSLLSLEISKL